MDQLFELEKLTEQASLPYGIEQVDGGVEFCIKDFESIKEKFTSLYAPLSELVVTKENVAAVEKDAAKLKKFADIVKKTSSEYCEQFTSRLIGKGRGKSHVDGEVDELVKLIMSLYDQVHERTKAVRDEGKFELPKEEVFKFEVKCPVTQKGALMKYLTENKIPFAIK